MRCIAMPASLVCLCLCVAMAPLTPACLRCVHATHVLVSALLDDTSVHARQHLDTNVCISAHYIQSNKRQRKEQHSSAFISVQVQVLARPCMVQASMACTCPCMHAKTRVCVVMAISVCSMRGVLSTLTVRVATLTRVVHLGLREPDKACRHTHIHTHTHTHTDVLNPSAHTALALCAHTHIHRERDGEQCQRSDLTHTHTQLT